MAVVIVRVAAVVVKEVLPPLESYGVEEGKKVRTCRLSTIEGYSQQLDVRRRITMAPHALQPTGPRRIVTKPTRAKGARVRLAAVRRVRVVVGKNSSQRLALNVTVVANGRVRDQFKPASAGAMVAHPPATCGGIGACRVKKGHEEAQRQLR